MFRPLTRTLFPCRADKQEPGMNKHHRWLLDEVEHWRAEGLIDAGQAHALIARYDHEPATAWGKIIFSAIGAIIFGLGIILLFAYNWDAMHRYAKLAAIFIAILAAHSAGYYLNRPNSQHRKLGESLHLLGTMLFGAGIWLIAQIYHIDEYYPNGVLLWAMGALLLAWALPSLAHAMLALALLMLWHGFEVFDFHRANQSATWLIAFGILPLTWIHRSRVTLFFALALFMTSYATAVTGIELGHNTVITVLFSLACSYILFSRLVSATRFPESAGAFRVIGVGVYAVLLFLLTIGDVEEDLFRRAGDTVTALQWFYWLFPVALAVAGVLTLLLRYSDIIKEPVDRVETGIVLAALTVVLMASLKAIPPGGAGWVLLNLLFLTHSLVLIRRGTHTLRWQSVTLGSVMLAAFTFARFLDLFDSLILRALAFLGLGAALFAIGIYYSHQKQRAGLREQHA